MGSTIVCCTSRENDGLLDPVPNKHPACSDQPEDSCLEDNLPIIARSTSSMSDASDPEEFLSFFECVETEDELAALRRRAEQLDMLEHLPEQADCSACLRNLDNCFANGSPRSSANRGMIVKRVIERTREAWQVRVLKAAGKYADVCGFDIGKLQIEVDKPGLSATVARQILREGCPEMDEWANEAVARRMLRAVGNEGTATQMLLSAVGLRVSYRRLYRSMQCKVACDARIIAKDLEGRPFVWMSASSQSEPVKELRDQIILAFEACCKMQEEDATLGIIADMLGFNGRLNLDFFTLKELADVLGNVYADKIHRIVVVDFSRAAQMVWMTVKPLMSERTQQKFAFVNETEARRILQQHFDEDNYKRIVSSFAVNRDKSKTLEDRMVHAKRTAVGDVPFVANWSSSMSTGSTATTGSNGTASSLSTTSD